MKKYLKPEDLLEQKKLMSHVALFIFSVIIVVVSALREDFEYSFRYYLYFFIVLFIQIEIFIAIAGKIFKELGTGLSRKEFTITILSRFVLFMISCFIIALVIFIVLKLFMAIRHGDDIELVLKNFRIYEFNSWFRSTMIGLSFGAWIFLIIQWQDALKREQKLREENLIFQNETLKNQVNPHFLFNSLNTISFLVKTQPDIAAIFINDLSSVYRYILENGQKEKVPLQTELDFITAYFNLHKIRDDGKIILNNLVGETSRFEILPVSLQILLENAIKHNISSRENPLTISIYIENQFVVVSNNLQRKATQLKSTGIGLRNLAERVRLFTGKTLIIEESGNEFIVKIPLIL